MARGRKTSLMIDPYLGGTADAPGVGTFDHHSWLGLPDAGGLFYSVAEGMPISHIADSGGELTHA